MRNQDEARATISWLDSLLKRGDIERTVVLSDEGGIRSVAFTDNVGDEVVVFKRSYV